MSVKITKTLQVDFTLTPTEVAQIFWDMCGGEQATFFSELARIAGPKLIFQLQYVTDSDHLRPEGRGAMEAIGNYALVSCDPQQTS